MQDVDLAGGQIGRVEREGSITAARSLCRDTAVLQERQRSNGSRTGTRVAAAIAVAVGAGCTTTCTVATDSTATRRLCRCIPASALITLRDFSAWRRCACCGVLWTAGRLARISPERSLDFRQHAHRHQAGVDVLVELAEMVDDMLVEQFEDYQTDFKAGFDTSCSFVEVVTYSLRAQRVLPAFQIRIINQEADAFIQGEQCLFAGTADLVHHVGYGQFFFQVFFVQQAQAGVLIVQVQVEAFTVTGVPGDALIEAAVEAVGEILLDILANNAQLTHGIEILGLNHVAFGFLGA